MEQTFRDAIRDANIGSCLIDPEFQLKKKRVLFLRLLNSGSHGTAGLSTDQIRRVEDAVLEQQDERSTLAVLETFAKDDKGIFARIKGFFRSSSGEEGLWQIASKRASSISDSQFFLELETVPVGGYRHDAVIDVETTAYACLAKQVDDLVSQIGQDIISTQKIECDRQVKREVDIKKTGEVHILWSNFVRQVKDVSTQHSTLYVPCGVWNGLQVRT